MPGRRSTDMAHVGIYRITVKRDGKPDKYYIGQSANLHDRKIRHFWELRRGIHRNPVLQQAFNLYGESALIFDVLEECELDKVTLAEREKFYIDAHCGRLYNVNIEQATTSLGTKRTAETRRKMSLAQKAVGMTDGRKEVLAAMISANIGRKLTQESIAKRTAKQKGVKRSEETKRRLSESAKLRPPMSDETRRKISETKKARGQCPPCAKIKREATQCPAKY